MAQNRNLQINLSADARQLERGMQRGEKAMEGYRRSVEDANTALNRLEQELQRDVDNTLAEVEARSQRAEETFRGLGTGMMVGGAAIAAGLGVAGRAAMQWESDWANVTKTVDGSPEQMGALEDSLRGLAGQIPVTHSELTQIAASAGQLGVETQNILGFTETIAQMGVTTNLTVEDAAMQMAKFSNIMGTPQEEIDRLGATIVDLGNNSATTESDILNMGMRIAGAGNTVGLAEDEVLAFSAALSSVGLEAEGGGGAFSRVMIQISDAAQQGGQDLQGFADVAEMSAEDFARSMQETPSEAMASFIDGLAGIKEEGGNVFATLESLGIVDTQTRDALLRAAGASDLLNESLATGAQAWEQNSALVEEAAERFGTTESQVKMAENALREFGIATGDVLLPVLGDAAERVQSWGQAYSSLSDETQGVVTGLGGTVSAVGLLTGAMIAAGPRLIEFRDNMADLSQHGSNRFRRGLGGVASFLTGPYGAAIGAAMALGGVWLDQKSQQIAEEQEWADVLAKSSGVIDENAKMHAIKNLQESKSLDLAKDLEIGSAKLVDGLLNEGDARDALNTLYENSNSLAVLNSGYNTKTGETYKEVQKALEEVLPAGTEWKDLTQEQQRQLTKLVKEMGGQIESFKGGQEQAELYNETMGETTTGYEAAQQNAKEYREQVDQLVDQYLKAIGAEVDWKEALANSKAALEENGATIDTNTEKGRANRRELENLVVSGGDHIESLLGQDKAAWKVAEEHENVREKIRKAAIQMGATKEEADKYANSLGDIPSDVKTDINVDAEGNWRLLTGESTRGPEGYFAEGGAVGGSGSPTSDNINAKLSPGEHVWTASEVSAAGGQEAMYALRQLVKDGDLRLAKGGAVQRFAKGGAVLPDSARIIRDHSEETRVNIQKLIHGTIDGLAGDMGSAIKKYLESGGPVVKHATKWKGTPYSWGGGGITGPSLGFGRGAGIRGFDCSSLMQYAWYHGTDGRVRLPRTTYGQINVGRGVSQGSERPGDLVFPHRGHVAMVANPGRLFHTFRTGSTAGYRSMYPNPIAIRRPGRYDDGGHMGPGETGVNLTRRPERVLDPDTTKAFDRLVDGLLSRGGVPAGGGGTVVEHTEYHVHHVPGYSTEQDLQRVAERRQRAARVGRHK